MMNQKSKTRHRGTIVVFEGISGSGKSENLKSIYKFLRDKKQRIALYEWNNNPILRLIASLLQKRGLLKPNIYCFLQWLGFVMDYIFVIMPLYHKGYVILADRYTYTGLTRDAANGAGIALGMAIHKRVQKPDILLFFDTDPRICYLRSQLRGKKLFFPTRKGPSHKQFRNRDLYYLRKIRRHYIRVFNNRTITGDMEIVKITSAYGTTSDGLSHWLLKRVSFPRSETGYELNPLSVTKSKSICSEKTPTILGGEL